MSNCFIRIILVTMSAWRRSRARQRYLWDRCGRETPPLTGSNDKCPPRFKQRCVRPRIDLKGLVCKPRRNPNLNTLSEILKFLCMKLCFLCTFYLKKKPTFKSILFCLTELINQEIHYGFFLQVIISQHIEKIKVIACMTRYNVYCMHLNMLKSLQILVYMLCVLLNIKVLNINVLKFFLEMSN